MDSNEHAELRQTAAEWNGGPSSALFVYACSGTVTDGLFGEIEDCLALVERGAVNPDTDVVAEHARLKALLSAATVEAVKLTAHAIGQQHGRRSAGLWRQDTIGGRAHGDTAARARQILQAHEDGDRAILDALPSLQVTGWPVGYTPANLASACLGPVPDPVDTSAHQTWHDAQPGLRGAYETGFNQGAYDAAIQACRHHLGQRPKPSPTTTAESTGSHDGLTEHRRAAAEWHGGQSSALYAYASTGTVTKGLLDEVKDCLALVDRGAVDPDIDIVAERARLGSLLDAVQPEVALLQAEAIGYDHGEVAAGWWQQDTIGGRATWDTAAVARRVMQGLDDGDPEVLDALPSVRWTGWPDDYTPTDLANDCGWPEPDPGDADSHWAWLDAQPGLRDAFEAAFNDGLHDAVVESCRHRLDQDHSPVQAALARLDGGPPAPSHPTDGLGL